MRKNLLKNMKLTVSKDHKEIKQIPLIKFSYSALAISFLSIIFVLFVYNKLPPVVPLLYGLPEGEMQLVKTVWLIIPALFSILIAIINIVISLFLESTFLKELLIVSSFVVSMFSAITIFKIIFLVGNIL